ncbi:hypothetical protein PICSAR141_04241 [Mycobacterium avium subsp. paratuberculosis]|nr:hypothetical protein PICSAR141_04241 [Mycobacterium avium subsp. paratuberculosis]
MVDLPPACSNRSESAVRQYSGPTMAASASRSAGDSVDGRNRTCSGRGSAVRDPSIPTACCSNDRMPSESGLAAAGSPQAFHFIGGSSRFGCVMRYSITDAVNP